MASPVRPTRLNVDLLGYKQPWLAYCAAHQTTPSEAFRLIVAKLIAVAEKANGEHAETRATGTIEPRTAPTDASSDDKDGDNGSANDDQRKSPDLVRKEIRLTASELAAAERLALREGFSVTRWIGALVRSRIDGTAQLGQAELELLARSNQHILALGRSVNQIARLLHASPEGGSAVPPELVQGCTDAVRAHARVVARVLEANQRRWRRA